jgi:hypothetical protein
MQKISGKIFSGKPFFAKIKGRGGVIENGRSHYAEVGGGDRKGLFENSEFFLEKIFWTQGSAPKTG